MQESFDDFAAHVRRVLLALLDSFGARGLFRASGGEIIADLVILTPRASVFTKRTVPTNEKNG